MPSAIALVGALVVTGGVAVAAIAWLGTDLGGNPSQSNAAAHEGNATGTPAASTVPRARATSATPSLPPTVSFDLHPIGRLDPTEVSATRIIGEPEVVSLPSPFDRSLRLSGAAAGICVAALGARDGRSSIAFDLLLSETAGSGRLDIGLVAIDTAPASGLAVELALLDLTPDAWYQLTATSDGSTGTLTVALRGGESVLETQLGLYGALLPGSPNDSCLRASFTEGDASVLVDNLRVDR